MASKLILFLLIVTFTVQVLAFTCPNRDFLTKHVFKGSYNGQTLKELTDFADKHAHDRIRPVSKQTVYVISDNSEKEATKWSYNDVTGKCMWKKLKTKFIFARK